MQLILPLLFVKVPSTPTASSPTTTTTISASSVSVLSRIVPSTVTSEDAIKCGGFQTHILPRQSSIGGGGDHCIAGIDGTHSTGSVGVTGASTEGPPTPTHSEIPECAKGKSYKLENCRKICRFCSEVIIRTQNSCRTRLFKNHITFIILKNFQYS